MSAIIAPSDLYRYMLGCEWDAIAPRFGFVMLNSITADATSNDATTIYNDARQSAVYKSDHS